jgi:AmiR/NasT family two-component response regulator
MDTNKLVEEIDSIGVGGLIGIAWYFWNRLQQLERLVDTLRQRLEDRK